MALRPLLTDCPCCLVEAALVEVYADHVLVEATCRLCGYGSDGEERREGRRFADVGEVIEALGVWAADDGEPDLERFCEANFAGLPSFEVALRVMRRERVETGFDVIAFLFPQAALALPTPRKRPAPDALPELLPTLTVVPWENLPPQVGRTRSVLPPPEPPPAPPPVDRADVTRALWAIALADGRVDAREDRVVERLCRELEAPPMPRSEARLWRPGELSRPADAARVIDAMEKVARADDELDRSEIRVLFEYARAWGVPVRERRWRPPPPWREAWRGMFG